ncbi:class I glutamine amidotransferase-like protein [Cercophora scortea]|uniref:Class I glutamine amidotransferase-like protein n=1 Tax=Cercophora scortea TaxID=314031 RepID=A0AAE0J274_9PEZI|nr:class I glutamine amidotransferase-like protein [Cercophora scortea]
MPAQRKVFRIGVMLEEVQLSDIVGVDIFGNLSREYMDLVKTLLPSSAQYDEHAMDMEFLYLATTLTPAKMTPGITYQPTVTYDACPRDLDMVIVGGPVLTHRPPQAEKFMKEAWNRTPVWLTTCIGSMWLASTGLLEGMKVTTNKEVLDLAREMYPGVEWIRQRWMVAERPFDGPGGKGELWTAGGAGAGVDMFANYCLEKYDPGFVKTLALEPLEFNPESSNGQFYD